MSTTHPLHEFLSARLAAARPSAIEHTPGLASLETGDLVFVDEPNSQLRRLALIAEIFGQEPLVRIYLCSNEPEGATDLCPIFERKDTSFTPTVVVHAINSGWVLAAQISHRVGHISTDHLDAIEDAFRTEGASLDGLPRGRPLPLTRDPRHQRIQQDAADLNTLTAAHRNYQHKGSDNNPPARHIPVEPTRQGDT